MNPQPRSPVSTSAHPPSPPPVPAPGESGPIGASRGRDRIGTPGDPDLIGSPRERGVALALLLAALALRLAGIWEYRFNSDETQHAHVMWGWTRGLLQYRDLFDNHTPLFHMLWAPLLAALGESVRTLFWLRLSMLPLYLAALALTYAIGRRLLSPRAALWGTVLTALLPPFFVKTLELRTDVPWALLWLAVVQVATGGAVGPGRLLAVGLLAGAAAAVSLKSSLLVACLLVAALAAAVWPAETGGTAAAGGGPARGAGKALAGALAGLAGLLAVPAAVVLYFQRRGAIDALLAGAVRHNLQVSQHGPSPLRRIAILAAGVPLLLLAAQWSRHAGPPALARQRLLLALFAGSYLIAVEALWPLVTSQTYLPVEPLLCLLVAAAAVGTGRRAALGDSLTAVADLSGPAALGAGLPAGERGRRRLRAGSAFLALALAVELVIDLLHGPLRGDQTRAGTAMAAAALRLTAPGEPVFDDKGDAVFRRRAFFPVLEDITREAMARGRIADTIPESILASGACLATLDGPRLPPRGKAFLNANFLPVGRVRVCGKWLAAPAAAAAEPSGAAPPGAVKPSRAAPPAGWSSDAAPPDTREPPNAAGPAIRFVVAIPARYTILTPAGPARGRLDGVELAAPRQLAAGPHLFEPRSAPPLALLWARAAERGFSPFPPPAPPPAAR
jgi:hypothetical protein